MLTAQLALHCGHLLAVDVSEADLARAADLLIAALNPGGQLLLVHWTPPVHDYPLTGDEVPQFFS